MTRSPMFDHVGYGTELLHAAINGIATAAITQALLAAAFVIITTWPPPPIVG